MSGTDGVVGDTETVDPISTPSGMVEIEGKVSTVCLIDTDMAESDAFGSEEVNATIIEAVTSKETVEEKSKDQDKAGVEEIDTAAAGVVAQEPNDN